MPGLDQLGAMATIVPSALTVQIMNPNALQTTNGIIYIGRLKTQVRGEDETGTWDALGQEFVSFQAPRLCSAGKLALRGVKVDAVPFNVQELMDFDRVVDPMDTTESDFVEPWRSSSVADGSTAINPRWKMKGFAPIGVYNPNNVALQYLVTLEYRCRFDMGHPAASTHTHHAPSSQQSWASHIKSLLDAGHGAFDIAEELAQFGARMRGAYAAARPLMIAA